MQLINRFEKIYFSPKGYIRIWSSPAYSDTIEDMVHMNIDRRKGTFIIYAKNDRTKEIVHGLIAYISVVGKDGTVTPLSTRDPFRVIAEKSYFYEYAEYWRMRKAGGNFVEKTDKPLKVYGTDEKGEYFLYDVEDFNTSEWGKITGDLDKQTDLWIVLQNKVEKTVLPLKVYGTDENGAQYLYSRDDFLSEWGEIDGDITKQTDLMNMFATKVDKEVSGSGGNSYVTNDGSKAELYKIFGSNQFSRSSITTGSATMEVRGSGDWHSLFKMEYRSMRWEIDCISDQIGTKYITFVETGRLIGNILFPLNTDSAYLYQFIQLGHMKAVTDPLEQKVNALSLIGDFLGTYATENDLPATLAGAKVNDYCYVEEDSAYNGATTMHMITSMGPPLVWTFMFKVNTDITGKVDKTNLALKVYGTDDIGVQCLYNTSDFKDAEWGKITGDLDKQTDLWTILQGIGTDISGKVDITGETDDDGYTGKIENTKTGKSSSSTVHMYLLDVNNVVVSEVYAIHSSVGFAFNNGRVNLYRDESGYMTFSVDTTDAILFFNNQGLRSLVVYGLQQETQYIQKKHLDDGLALKVDITKATANTTSTITNATSGVLIQHLDTPNYLGTYPKVNAYAGIRGDVLELNYSSASTEDGRAVYTNVGLFRDELRFTIDRGNDSVPKRTISFRYQGWFGASHVFPLADSTQFIQKYHLDLQDTTLTTLINTKTAPLADWGAYSTGTVAEGFGSVISLIDARVEKSTSPDMLYGTDEDGNQTLYDVSGLGGGAWGEITGDVANQATDDTSDPRFLLVEYDGGSPAPVNEYKVKDLIAGSNITLTYNSTNKTYTVASTGGGGGGNALDDLITFNVNWQSGFISILIKHDTTNKYYIHWFDGTAIHTCNASYSSDMDATDYSSSLTVYTDPSINEVPIIITTQANMTLENIDETKIVKNVASYRTGNRGGVATWGTITGTMSSQTDLQGEFDNVLAKNFSKIIELPFVAPISPSNLYWKPGEDIEITQAHFDLMNFYQHYYSEEAGGGRYLWAKCGCPEGTPKMLCLGFSLAEPDPKEFVIRQVLHSHAAFSFEAIRKGECTTYTGWITGDWTGEAEAYPAGSIDQDLVPFYDVAIKLLPVNAYANVKSDGSIFLSCPTQSPKNIRTTASHIIRKPTPPHFGFVQAVDLGLVMIVSNEEYAEVVVNKTLRENGTNYIVQCSYMGSVLNQDTVQVIDKKEDCFTLLFYRSGDLRYTTILYNVKCLIFENGVDEYNAMECFVTGNKTVNAREYSQTIDFPVFEINRASSIVQVSNVSVPDKTGVYREQIMPSYVRVNVRPTIEEAFTFSYSAWGIMPNKSPRLEMALVVSKDVTVNLPSVIGTPVEVPVDFGGITCNGPLVVDYWAESHSVGSCDIYTPDLNSTGTYSSITLTVIPKIVIKTGDSTLHVNIYAMVPII